MRSKTLGHVYTVLCKTTTWITQNLGRLRTETPTAKIFKFLFGTQRSAHTVMQKFRCGAVRDGKPAICEILPNNKSSFFNRHFPRLCLPDCVSSLTLTRWGQENKHFPLLIYFYSFASRFVRPSPKMSIATPAKGQGSGPSYRPLSLFFLSFSFFGKLILLFTFLSPPKSVNGYWKTMKPANLDKLLCATGYWLTFHWGWVTLYTSALNEALICTSSTTASYVSYTGF